MPGYNTKFDLTVEDMDVIEEALRGVTTKLSSATSGAQDATGGEVAKVRHIHDLLGRLHNQKVFYRPANGAYVGG